MTETTLFRSLACIGVLGAASAALGQVPTLINGNLESGDPVFPSFKAEGFRTYNYATWPSSGAVARSGTRSARLPGGEGRPAGEFEGIETEDCLDPNEFECVYNWPQFNFNPPNGDPLKVGFWFNISAADAMVVSRFGLKFSIQRNAPGDFSSFQTWEFFDIDPAAAMAPAGTVITTRMGPFGPNGETITLPAIHTNGQWVKLEHTINQSEICTDFTGQCPIPPTNPAYVKIMAFRFDFPDNLPCGGSGEPACVRNRSYGTVWVDDFFFSQAPACIADYNGSGSVTVQDLFDYLAAWFARCTAPGPAPCQFGSADVNNSGMVTVQDLFDFLALWFARCP